MPRLSSKQRAVLAFLAARPIFGAESILEIVRRVDGVSQGHAAGYARVHRLAKRGLVRLVQAAGQSQHVLITARGIAAAL